MRYLLGLLLFIVAASVLAETTVFEKEKNIYYQHEDLPPIKLTHTGQNYTPVLSPNGRFIAFVRIGKTPMPERCTHFANTHTSNGEQVWIIDIKQHQEKLLVEPHYACGIPTKMILDPKDLAFSPDSKTLYFTTSAWTTSGALHAVQVDGKHLRYIMPANVVKIVMEGEYKGHLLVSQHRYFVQGGSFDWFWLFTPTGKEVGPVGEEPTLVF